MSELTFKLSKSILGNSKVLRIIYKTCWLVTNKIRPGTGFLNNKLIFEVIHEACFEILFKQFFLIFGQSGWYIARIDIIFDRKRKSTVRQIKYRVEFRYVLENVSNVTWAISRRTVP